MSFGPLQTASPLGVPLRWGLIGAGSIASAFAEDLRLLGEAEVVAVASRSQVKVDAFADRFNIPRRHASYADLVDDPEVDVVYVATPNALHYECAMSAMRAGKSVLVEKPFTLNAIQAQDLVSIARTSGAFLMEAMWMRFLPHMLEIKQIISAGVIGDVRTVTADLGARFAMDPASRLFAPELGGGALLDLGVYPVSFASMVLGAPIAIKALSSPTFTGVDAQTSILLHYAGGSHAVLTTTLEAEGANRATIIGTDARIEVDPVFLRPTSFSLIHPDGRTDRHEHTTAGVGLHYEAAEVGRCIRAGLKESPGMPLDESVQIMEILDEVRRQVRLAYPQEHPA